ncbi:MAG: hypothetical protein IJG34_03195 [Synergistaceae bacterium]|nr:hypothetical protein [Synergistaceae bacterium]
MPFLRAALLKKKAKQEEEEKLLPPVIAVESESESESEPEPDIEEFHGFEQLHRLIDEKAELEEAKENENAGLDNENLEHFDESETLSDNTENICVPESDSDSDNVSAVQEEAQEQQQEIESESEQELTAELELESESEQEQPTSELETETESESEQEQEVSAEQKEPEENEPEQIQEIISQQESQPEIESEAEHEETLDTHEQEFISEAEFESVNEPEQIEPTEHEPESESENKNAEHESENESESESEGEPGEFKLKYDFTSGERYVDSVSTKTEFDKMLDELGAISGELLSHEVEKFAKQFTGKFQGDFDRAESDAKKYEAFLGGYITNAAMILYDNGYRDTAIKRLEQAKSILEARKKLEDETAAIKTRVEEENDSVDLSDILGLFGD